MDSGWEGLLLGVWQREDALWYEKIATVGYSAEDMTQQFFPLFPMAMRLLSLVSGMHPVAAGIAVSEASLLAALFLLHRLLVSGFGQGVADRTLVYFSLFPSAFFLHGPFSESLMLALVVLAFFLVSRGRWAEAALAAYLAGLTRPQGVLLGAPLAMQLLASGRTAARWRSFRWGRGRLLRSALLLAAPLLGLITFQSLVDTPWRHPGVPGGVGTLAQESATFPGAALLFAGQRILGGAAHPIDLFDFTVAVVFLSLAAVSFAKLEAGYFTYATLFVLAPLSRFTPNFPLMSISRYMLLLFPCFVVLALWGRRKWVHLAIIFLWLWWLGVWSARFYTGYFVG